MDEDIIESNLNTLKDMLLDEQKLVTYVSLSKELCIHVNQSKSLLRKFVEEIKEKKSDVKLNVSYIISGLTENNKARTTVSSEDEIENIRKTFKNVFFEHIYSVGKGLTSVDNVALMAINKFEDFPICLGLIKSNSCIKRTSEEIGNLKSNSQDIAFTDQKQTNPPEMKIKEKSNIQINGHGERNTVTKVHETKSEPTIKSEIPSPKKNALGKQKTDTKKNGNKTQKGITGFFSKSNSAPSKKSVKDTIDSNFVKQEIEIKESAVKEETSFKETALKQKTAIKESIIPEDTEVKIEKMEVDEEIKKEKEEVKTETKKGNIKGKSKNKSVNPNKKNAKIEKKRKRVLHISDSESEDEKDPFADEPVDNYESEDEIPPTPSVNTVKITSGLVNPKKKRKVVDKTYTDEEGYILTKKEVVYESCSDNEEEVCTKENVHAQPVIQVKQDTSPKGKKNGTKNTKKKISPPQKGKQATLMNFFKKA